MREILAQLREHAQKGLLICCRCLPSDDHSCSICGTFFVCPTSKALVIVQPSFIPPLACEISRPSSLPAHAGRSRRRRAVFAGWSSIISVQLLLSVLDIDLCTLLCFRARRKKSINSSTSFRKTNGCKCLPLPVVLFEILPMFRPVAYATFFAA